MVNGGHRNSVAEESSVESVEEISPTQKDVNDKVFLEEPQRNSRCRTSVRKFIVAGKDSATPNFQPEF